MLTKNERIQMLAFAREECGPDIKIWEADDNKGALMTVDDLCPKFGVDFSHSAVECLDCIVRPACLKWLETTIGGEHSNRVPVDLLNMLKEYPDFNLDWLKGIAAYFGWDVKQAKGWVKKTSGVKLVGKKIVLSGTKKKKVGKKGDVKKAVMSMLEVGTTKQALKELIESRGGAGGEQVRKMISQLRKAGELEELKGELKLKETKKKEEE